MTPSPPIDPEVESRLGRLLDKLPVGDDLDLIVLKGHLLIEERLRDIVRVPLARRPTSLDEARLRFAQLATLARGMVYEESRDWTFQAVNKLNSIRNDLVHELDPQCVEKLTEELVAILKPHIDVTRRLGGEGPAGRLRSAIAFLYGMLDSAEHRLRTGSLKS